MNTSGACSYINATSSHLLVARIKDKLAEDPNNHGDMLTPIILDADETAVSVATGHQEYHEVYMSLGHIHNDASGPYDALLPIAFSQYVSSDLVTTLKGRLSHSSSGISSGGRDKATDGFRTFTK